MAERQRTEGAASSSRCWTTAALFDSAPGAADLRVAVLPPSFLRPRHSVGGHHGASGTFRGSSPAIAPGLIASGETSSDTSRARAFRYAMCCFNALPRVDTGFP